jgi:thiosulfate dehydrogenase [quinone] large subunit
MKENLVKTRSGDRISAAGRNRGARIGMPAGLCAVQLVLAYEWLVSGINKLINPNFTVQLASTLRQSIDGNPYSWYVGFLRQVVLPHASLFGVLTELGELAIGVTLMVGVVLWLRLPDSRITHLVGRAASLALAGAAFLSLNYFFQGGSPLPWVDPANAFNEGVDIDILIPLLAVTLLVANLRALGVAGDRVSRVRVPVRERVPWAS